MVRIIALNAADKTHGELTSQVGIFAVSLLSPSPAWIAKNIDVRRPDGQALIANVIVTRTYRIEFGSSLDRNRGADLTQQVWVPTCRQTNRLRKYGGIAITSDAMQALAPPIVGGDTKPRYGRRITLRL
jgi:hypothetical protein